MNLSQAVFATALFAALAVAPGSAADGEPVYRATCAACHDAGVAGAPKLGDAAAWQGRLDKGVDAMLEIVVRGVQGYSGTMPPRGGNPALSDAELRGAIEFMLDQLP
jgi:cytochrome c5